MSNMAFSQEISEAIRSYATAHLPDENWHRQFFSFVSNTVLASRLGDEFLATRFVYKVLEGLTADPYPFTCDPARSWATVTAVSRMGPARSGRQQVKECR